MKFITPEFEAKFKNYPLGSQRDKDNPLVVAKLYESREEGGEFGFHFLLEYSPETKIGYGLSLYAFDERELRKYGYKKTWGELDVSDLELWGEPGSATEVLPTIKEDFNFQSKPVSKVLEEIEKSTI